MIEINLLPGAASRKKKSRSGGGGSSFDIRSALGGIGGRVKDPYLIAAVAGVVLGLGVVGYMYTSQASREEALVEAEEVAISDSTRLANYTKQRRKAEATRDTVLRQINIIRTIDGDRYLWPHLMDEVSRALPQYTWLTTLSITGTLQGTNTPLVVGNDSAQKSSAKPKAKPPAGTKAKAVKDAGSGVDTVIVRDEVRVTLEGQTVDLEAITRFMRQLEASPFIAAVELGKSQLTLEQGKEVTTFTLEMTYVRQDGDLVRRVPLTASTTASAAPAAGN